MNPDESKSPEKNPDEKVEAVSRKPVDPSQLTPEEHMALYEDELKETDWGHQPC